MNKSFKIITSAIWTYVCLFKVLPLIISKAYNIRLLAINEYGPIIHEFDPYFNYRATEYLYENGWAKFVTWFDYKSWYPLGRPVGTTIYPGMQVTAVFIKHHVLPNMSLNDICAYIPAWFGAIASVLTGLIAYECSLPLFDVKDASDEKTSPFGSILENIPFISKLYSMIVIPLLQIITKGIIYIFGSDLGLSNTTLLPTIYKIRKIVDLSSPAMEIGLIAAGIMSIVPAHMMRSVGGGYDNESIANTAMTLTFYFWCRTLRGGVEYDSWRTVFWGILSGLAYFYMVAVWGGYVFVINLIGVHAGVLVLLGRFGPKLYKGYSIFYTVGTALAIQVPVVGWTPLKSLEQLGPAAVFGGFQLLAFCDYQRKKKNLTPIQTWKLRIVVFAIAAVVAGLAAFVLDHYYGYFGPISARVRGLFVKHTKTGNPLVDSVAEHQPASSQAYDQYLGEKIVQMVPIGFGLVALKYFHDSSSFLLVYGAATYFFSHKMVRLVLLTAPIASIFAGIVLGRLLSFFMYNIIGSVPCFFDILLIDDDDDAVKDKDELKKEPEKSPSNKSKNKAKSKKNEEIEEKTSQPQNQQLNTARSIVCKLISAYAAYAILTKSILPEFEEFRGKSETIAASMSHPTIIMKAKLQSGQEVMVDDYRECYWWLRDNTPEDSRVMAWWDYGYQITAIANRTTIADGNTWNHEHIALLGRALTSSEKEGHRIARHMADYVLIWGGGGGDDLAKSPHLARIANSVYRSMCPNDPTCSRFGYTSYGPSKMMAESLLFKLHGHGLKPGVSADPNRFKHKFSSKYGKCRIFKVLSVSKESKEWVADPKNRDCDAPGSWYCRGQYPPGMAKILSEKRDFSQLEDFNKDEDDSEYQKKYFENLEKKRRSAESYNDPRDDPSSTPKKKQWKPARDVSPEMIEDLNSEFEDTEYTHKMWQLIDGNHVREVYDILKINPELAHLRSGDGRGPMFWAMENGNEKIIRVLKKLGVSDSRKDKKGLTARDLMKRGEL